MYFHHGRTLIIKLNEKKEEFTAFLEKEFGFMTICIYENNDATNRVGHSRPRTK